MSAVRQLFATEAQANRPGLPRGFGWIPDLTDVRDYTMAHQSVREVLATLDTTKPAELPQCFGWRESSQKIPESDPNYEYWSFFPPVVDQGSIRTSSVHAVLSLVQYFERRCTVEGRTPSRLFTYRAARQIRQVSGDNGASLRDVLKAVVRFGLPPEELWPYEPDRIDAVPDPGLFSYTENCAEALYVRLDPPGLTGGMILESVKRSIVAGFPCVCGFPVHSSIDQVPSIPFPSNYEALLGGQAVLVVGYRDVLQSGAKFNATGQLVIRSSWSPAWGFAGYGYLPYEYVTRGLAKDFWTLFSGNWLRRDNFGHPAPFGTTTRASGTESPIH